MALRKRHAFTLVEMMVAVALTLFIIVLLTQAFGTAVQSFRSLKAIGDMEERLRSASLILRKDLAAEHFGAGQRLSDPFFFKDGPPAQGFFRIFQGSASTLEGTDGDTVPSYSATNHVLHFTVRRQGNQKQDFFMASLMNGDALAYAAGSPPTGWSVVDGQQDTRYQDANTYTSTWAEVAYFLRNNGTTANGTPLFTLYRRQRLLVPNALSLNNGASRVASSDFSGPSTAQSYAEISCNIDPANTSYIYFNAPTDITVPQRRFSMDPTTDGGVPVGAGGTYLMLADPVVVGGSGVYLYSPIAGADALLTDVLSFDVQVGYPAFIDPVSGNSYTASHDANGNIDFADLPASTNNPLFNPGTSGAYVFDTWSSKKDGSYDYSTWNTNGTAKTIPLAGISIKAVRVTIRLWDRRTQQTRQVTVIQSL
jgi:Prokaryotic N-terminal methylation motif